MSQDEVLDYFVVEINKINDEFRDRVENLKKVKAADVEPYLKRLLKLKREFSPYRNISEFKELNDDFYIIEFECRILMLDTDKKMMLFLRGG